MNVTNKQKKTRNKQNRKKTNRKKQKENKEKRKNPKNGIYSVFRIQPPKYGHA